MDDLNTALANAAHSFANHAESHKRQADEKERIANETEGQFPGMGAQHRREAAQHKRNADVWQKRAELAKGGYLLIDKKDFGFQLGPYRNLYTEAAAQHRLKYLEDGGDDRDRVISMARPAAGGLGNAG
jgi:hypothetical protein